MKRHRWKRDPNGDPSRPKDNGSGWDSSRQFVYCWVCDECGIRTRTFGGLDVGAAASLHYEPGMAAARSDGEDEVEPDCDLTMVDLVHGT